MEEFSYASLLLRGGSRLRLVGGSVLGVGNVEVKMRTPCKSPG
jgi:hypothetical protein